MSGSTQISLHLRSTNYFCNTQISDSILFRRGIPISPTPVLPTFVSHTLKFRSGAIRTKTSSSWNHSTGTVRSKFRTGLFVQNYWDGFLHVIFSWAQIGRSAIFGREIGVPDREIFSRQKIFKFNVKNCLFASPYITVKCFISRLRLYARQSCR